MKQFLTDLAKTTGWVLFALMMLGLILLGILANTGFRWSL